MSDKENNKGGRPKKPIDYDKVEMLASVFCTQEEIGASLGVSVWTLRRDKGFALSYKKGMEKAKASLRRNQFLLSQNNPTMAIWLGKQYLGQSDKQDHNIDGEIKIDIKWDK